MKASLIILFSVMATFGFGQCVQFQDDTLLGCAGSSVTFNGFPTNALAISQEVVDFNSNSLPTGWSTSGGTNYTQPCGTGIDNTPYFWASTSGTGTPIIQSAPYDFTVGGFINFDFIYAEQAATAPCEGPDLSNEGMQLEYSIDGGISWLPVVYYSPGGFELPSNPGTTGPVASGPTPYTTWNSISVPVPQGAQTPNSMFRWIQYNSSGTCCDNWGVDNITFDIVAPGLIYQWDTGATTLALTVSSNVDTTFYLSVFDSNNAFICEDSVHLMITSQGFDNGIQAIYTPFIQGLPTTIIVHAYNDGCPPQSGEIIVKMDSLLSFVSSTPAPDVTTPDSLIYYYNNLYLNGSDKIINILGLTSTSAMANDTSHLDMYISPISGDLNPNNNVKNYDVPVWASYDPNDKKVYPRGDCDVGYVPNNQLMTYTVRFQNTGTSDAIDVRVNDILDNNLDPATLRVVAASDTYVMDWLNSNEVDFVFKDINLPPQSQGELESIGYIVFEIEQLQGLAHGTPFTNQVDIFFDFNPPITTNQVLNTVTDGSHYVVGDTLVITAQSAYNWNGQLLTSSGVYSQSFPLSDGCDSTAILSLTIESEAGLNILANNPFVVYPNPAKSHLVVEGSQEGTLRLITPSGSVVTERKLFGNSTLRLDDISNGIYVIEIVSNGITYRERLIVNK